MAGAIAVGRATHLAGSIERRKPRDQNSTVEERRAERRCERMGTARARCRPKERGISGSTVTVFERGKTMLT
ncbi:MAG: hypothetical protein AB7P24_16545 [Nitrospira sp.]|nr:hypothetical protein [Nitrospira sp.]